VFEELSLIHHHNVSAGVKMSEKDENNEILIKQMEEEISKPGFMDDVYKVVKRVKKLQKYLPQYKKVFKKIDAELEEVK